MSGTWRERVDARKFLKPADVADALRELSAAVDRLEVMLTAKSSAVTAAVVVLQDEVAALTERVAKLEGPQPVKRPVAAKSADPAGP